MKDFFYPFYKKEELFERGFIARRSAHTRGAAVDLTLILKGHKLLPPDYTVRLLEDGRLIPFIDDGTIDMGSSFDLFHEVSEISTPLVSLVAQNRRDYLQKVMSAHGFKGYSKEWWHFQLIDEPFPDTYFDFPIVAS